MIIEAIYKALRVQRGDLKMRVRTADFQGWNAIECTSWLENQVFIYNDILETAIKDFCNVENVQNLNDFRDYQHETVQLCLDAFETHWGETK